MTEVSREPAEIGISPPVVRCAIFSSRWPYCLVFSLLLQPRPVATRLDSRRARATARLLLTRSHHAPFSLRSPRRRDRQRNRRLDSRSSEPLDNFAHANRDDATDAPTTRSFRIHVYFCSMREPFRKSGRNDSAKRFRPRLVSLLRFRRKIARYGHENGVFLLLSLSLGEPMRVYKRSYYLLIF